MAKKQRGGRVTAKGTQPAGFSPRAKTQLNLATQIQERMTAARAEVDARTFTGSAGGVVTVELTGDGEPQRVHINRGLYADAVDSGDGTEIEDLVLAAMRQAVAAVEAAHELAAEQAGVGELNFDELGLSGLLGP